MVSKLSLKSMPDGATIVFDGITIGHTNRDGSDASHPLIMIYASGEHTLKLSLDGYYDKTSTITAVSGQDLAYDFFLIPDPSYVYTHNRCQSGMCILAPGEGTDECPTVGKSCGEFHNECQDGTCTKILGAGTDACDTVGESCNTTTTTDTHGNEKVAVAAAVVVGAYLLLRRRK